MNTSPDSSWFYSENQEKKGPVPFSKLQTLLAGQLPASTLVWTEGMDEWVAASTIPELSGSTTGGDQSNPYAPPSAGELSATATGDLELGQIPSPPPPLEIGFCIGQGWKFTTGNLGRLIVFGLVYIVLAGIVSGVLTLIATSIEGTPTQTVVQSEDGSFRVESTGGGPITFICNIVSQIFSLFLTLGAIRYGHRLLKGEEPEINELFSQGSKVLTAVGASILFALAVGIGLVLLVIPGIFLALRLGLYQQAIVEKNLGVIDSLKYSYELTKGNALSLLGLYIVGFFIAVAGLLALVVGLIWAIPTVWLSSIIAFRYLHGGPNTIRVIQ